jgi:GNAT superfamily N-acetyltransferase
MDDEHPELERLARLAGLARKRGRISIRGARFDRLDEEIDSILLLLNGTLGPNPDSIPWYREPLKEMLEPLVRIADPELILFAETEGKVIGWFPGIPNFNEVLIRLNGLRSPLDYLKLPFASRRQVRCLSVKSVLVLPQYQKSGAGALLFYEMYRRARERGYQWIDLSLTSEDNPETPVLAGRFGAYEYKRYQVYKKDVQPI